MRKSYAAACLLAALLLIPQSGFAKKKDKDNDSWDGYEQNLPPGQAKKQHGGGPPPWAPAHGYRAKQAYRYYPKYNVYQDPQSGVFFNFQAGAWVKGGLPTWLNGKDLGRSYEFEAPAGKPYQGNRTHKRQYKDD